MRSSELQQHRNEIRANRLIWDQSSAVRRAYREFFERIRQSADFDLAGPAVEIGSGIGKLKEAWPEISVTDFVSNAWLDLVMDAYDLPFEDGCLSHLVLIDVFHHLERPMRFLEEAHRVLMPSGRVILLEPYIGWIGWLVYGLCHREPIAWGQTIDSSSGPSARNGYYAAQGNATRLFFRQQDAGFPSGWRVPQREAFACFYYLLTGGFSGPTLYPSRCFPMIKRLDHFLSRWPRVFGARCLVVLEKGERRE